MPDRIKLSRAKGWRLPPGAMRVCRPTRWGNPYPVAGLKRAIIGTEDWAFLHANNPFYLWTVTGTPSREDHAALDAIAHRLAVDAFRAQVESLRRGDPEGFEAWIAPLRGRDLACWCPLDRPCHADVLLEIANEPVSL